MALTHDAVDQAVKITIAAIPLSSGTMLSSPKVVADFIEVVANKIEELKNGPRPLR
jgi:predicted ATP-dependent protease